MVICKWKDYAFKGATAVEAYEKFLDSDDVSDITGPENLEWFTATPMKLVMSLAPLPQLAQPVKRGK